MWQSAKTASRNQRRAFLAAAILVIAATAAGAQDLVTPVRVGRTEAPLTLQVWAQQDYSHLAARPAIADPVVRVHHGRSRVRGGGNVIHALPAPFSLHSI